MPSTLTEATDPWCLRPGESAALLRDHPWRRFVVLGDSVAEGLCEPMAGYPTTQWADRVGEELRAVRPELAYLNLGLRGLRAREVRATQLAPAVDFRPDLALVVCGGNDAFRPAYDANAVDAELTAMVEALRAAGADVITVGMFDVSHSPAVPATLRAGIGGRMRRLAARTKALADRLGTIHVHLTDHPLTADPSMYSSDGRHGSARSDAVATAETLRRLGDHVDRHSTQRAVVSRPAEDRRAGHHGPG
ncbi:SGNH/GDSL hydrolase family protein [Solwaraspora sp. WMMD406]|uniref:SGNH/GDSL hydrolase family protein n=1 Tax=Solwaraspora sp. WMMD406 TaxID=3016095 RepID=UPI0024175F8D|nr:SGNH/GDSL hydrolase family protein [Solwaraspora sp. WMMD406]MDG4764625.1 SGNH/GDSL hydrolase family protein [Solwaraspora sp. WMMD406]